MQEERTWSSVQFPLWLHRAWILVSHFPGLRTAGHAPWFVCASLRAWTHREQRGKVLKSALCCSQEFKLHGARQTLNQVHCVIGWATHSPGKLKEKLLIWIPRLLPRPCTLSAAVAVMLHIGFNIADASGSSGTMRCFPVWKLYSLLGTWFQNAQLQQKVS